jgi:predicted lipoprotein with Yx(FWY)xxD motif
MRKPWTLIGISVLVAALAVATIACGGSKKNTSATQTAAYQTPITTQTSATSTATGATPNATAATQATTASTPSEGATVIATQNATLGKILTDSSGKTLYKYASDAAGVSNCTSTCAQNWPPLTITSGTPTAGTGVTGALATITRADGTTQVTLDGSPLYYFASDTAAGDATGDGVGGFSVITLGG